MSKKFKSYVNNFADGKECNDEEKTSNSMFYDKKEPSWLPGEVLIGEIGDIQKFNVFSDRKQGHLGTLFCTNFRLCFISLETLPTDQQSCSGQKNKLLKDDDIALTNIETLTQMTKGRRRDLQPNIKFTERVKTLEISCKDFSVHTFGFKMANRHDEKKFINSLIHHAFPSKVTLKFSFDYKGDKSDIDSVMPYPTTLFNSLSDFENELKRLNCDTLWRVTCLNEHYETQNMPPYFVVPNSAALETKDPYRDTNFKGLFGHYNDGRIPAWCYTYRGQSSLVRMAHLKTDRQDRDTEVKEQIGLVHKKKLVLDIHEHCPSLKDLSISFDKLKALCMPIGSLKDFWTNDTLWYNALDSTQWLDHILALLKVAMDTVSALTDQLHPKTVILQEFDDRDFNCAISSLVQIILDPYYRTIGGFQSLIQKEWIAMAHRFHTTYADSSNHSESVSPVFMLFLDSVWQIMQQHPSEFEFSEIYLTILWDSVHLGIFGTFLFDSPHDRQSRCTPDKFSDQVTHLMSTWEWSQQFDHNELLLFKNPLYIAKAEVIDIGQGAGTHDADLLPDQVTNKDSVNGDITGGLTLSDYARIKETREFRSSQTKHSGHVLDVIISAAKIKLWPLCYLRWAVPIEIYGGGSSVEYLQQCLLVEEVIGLNKKMNSLDRRASETKVHQRKSQLYFGGRDKHKQPVTSHDDRVPTSSFPFITGGAPSSKTVLGTPLSLYIEKSDFHHYEGDEQED